MPPENTNPTEDQTNTPVNGQDSVPSDDQYKRAEENLPPSESVQSNQSEPAELPASPVLPPEPQNTEPAPVATTHPEGEVSSSTPKKKNPLVWIVALIIIVIIVAAGFLLIKHNTFSKKKDIPLFSYAIIDSPLTPFYPNVNTDIMVQINSQLFETLVQYKNQTRIEPLLATSWYNKNNTTWVFNIRHNVKFHNGQPLTATAVKDSLEYAIKHQNAQNQGTVMVVASTMKDIKVTGPYQVTIVTNQPDPTLLNRLTQLYIFNPSQKVGNPDGGTGPYVITPGTTPTANSVYLSAVNNYWGGHVYTRKLHFANITQSQAVSAAGKYNLVGELTASEYSQIKQQHPGYTLISLPTLGVTFVGLNTLQPNSPFASLQARQAAQYALNDSKIIQAGGLSATSANQPIPPEIPGHDPSITNVPYDPAKAKQLLAGVKNANVPIKLEANSHSGDVNEVVKELNAVGFNVQLDYISNLNNLINNVLSGQTSMFMAAYDTNIFDGVDILSSIVVQPNYNNPAYYNLINEASNTLNPTNRINLMQKASQIIAKDVPIIPLYTANELFSVSNKNYHLESDLPSSEAGITFWKAYQK